MKRFMSKKLLVVGVAVALVIGIGGAAFAYWTSSGTGTGSAQNGTATSLLIDQLGGTPMYNSTIDPSTYDWSYAFVPSTGTNEFGNKINLAGGGGPLSDVVVAMANFDESNTPLPITLNIFNPGSWTGPGSQPGSLIATDTQTFSIPAAPNGGYYGTTCTAVRVTNPNSLCGIANFNITFDFSSQDITLPGTVVYGIAYNNTSVDESLNVQLSNEATQVSVGSDADPGYLFVSTLSGTDGATGGSGGEITCSDVSATFGEYSTAVNPTTGCGETTSSVAPYAAIALIPAVEIDTSTMSDLYPGGPAQPINFSVTNPGTIPATLNTVTITISSITNQHASAGPACDSSWYTIVQPSVIDGSVAAGQTWVDSPSGASIELQNLPIADGLAADQDACQGATVNLLFTSS
jgi:hypothetical protein